MYVLRLNFLLKKLGPTAEAVWLARQAAESVSAIGRFCDDHGIDAAYRRNGADWLGGGRGHPVGDAGAGAGVGFQPAFGNELSVRIGNGVAGDGEIDRERTR